MDCVRIPDEASAFRIQVITDLGSYRLGQWSDDGTGIVKYFAPARLD